MTQLHRACLGVAAFTTVLILLFTSDAYALWGNVMHEAPYAERGLAAENWVYPWVSTSPDGIHVSSIYAHHQDCNLVEGDGIYDWVTHNYVHAEAGLAKEYGQATEVFWQYNKTPWGLVDWAQGVHTTIPSSGYYVYFEINNVYMQNGGSDYWRMSCAGSVMQTALLPMTHARSLISSERLRSGDDMRSQFRNLRVKRNTGVWGPWVNCRWMARGVGGWSWMSYNPAHWYSYQL